MLTQLEREANRRSLDALAVEICCTMAGDLNAANYRFLKLIAEFDRRKGWSDGATQSCAHWLNWKCGIDTGAAREWVRVAHAIEKLPKVSAAMGRGEVSYSKVRALTRIACEDTEDTLLMIALHGTAHHMEKVVRLYRRAKEAEELTREAQQQANRFFSYRWDDDGSLVFKGSLPAEAGALFLKVLQAAMNELPAADVSAETSTVTPAKPAIAQKRADALALMAESFATHGVDALPGTDRQLISIHVSAETLRDRTAGCCELEDGPSISAETARRLACDASVVPILEDEDGAPLNVGRKTRTISTPLRRFLSTRDQGCRFPGCTNTRYVDAHHIHHWANGGETKPSNLVLLCRFHHRAVHEGGIDIQILDDGALRFVKRDGTSIDSVAPGYTQPFSNWTDVTKENDCLGIRIDHRTAATRWDGTTMNYGLGVEVLLQRARRAKRAYASPISSFQTSGWALM